MYFVNSNNCLSKFSDSNRSIGGYRIFRVITGSMIPQYDIGEVVISKETNPENIKVGDDIVYRGTYGDYSGKIIMHEVIQIDVDENNRLNFHAQGLHDSSVEDPQIKANQIYGVVKFKSRLLTILYKWATSIYSAFFIIIILVLNVFISFRVSGKEKVQRLGESIDDNNFEENENFEVTEDTETEDSEVIDKVEDEDDSEEKWVRISKNKTNFGEEIQKIEMEDLWTYYVNIEE